jgi:hypothetical protein
VVLLGVLRAPGPVGVANVMERGLYRATPGVLDAVPVNGAIMVLRIACWSRPGGVVVINLSMGLNAMAGVHHHCSQVACPEGSVLEPPSSLEQETEQVNPALRPSWGL